LYRSRQFLIQVYSHPSTKMVNKWLSISIFLDTSQKPGYVKKISVIIFFRYNFCEFLIDHYRTPILSHFNNPHNFFLKHKKILHSTVLEIGLNNSCFYFSCRCVCVCNRDREGNGIMDFVYEKLQLYLHFVNIDFKNISLAVIPFESWGVFFCCKVPNFYLTFFNVKINSTFDWNSRVKEKHCFSKNFFFEKHHFYW
jgi:hypothetical protein